MGLLWEVIDYIDGFERQAVLYWRLISANWNFQEDTFISDKCSINIEINNSRYNLELDDGMESKFYNKIDYLKAIKINIFSAPARVKTKIYKSD